MNNQCYSNFVTPYINKRKISEEAKFVNNEFDNKNDEDNESDNEPEDNQENNPATMWRFGQENTLFRRNVHTPPTLWVLCEQDKRYLSGDQLTSYWPLPSENRSCHSAPPAALCSPTPSRQRRAQELATAASSLGFNADTTEMSPPLIDELIESKSGNEPSTNIIPRASDIQSTSTNDFDYNSLFNNDSKELQCEQCEKKFRKSSDLHFHRQTHLIEQQQSSKNRTYQCHECHVVHRSRAHLEKHLLEQHEHLTVAGNK